MAQNPTSFSFLYSSNIHGGGSGVPWPAPRGWSTDRAFTSSDLAVGVVDNCPFRCRYRGIERSVYQQLDNPCGISRSQSPRGSKGVSHPNQARNASPNAHTVSRETRLRRASQLGGGWNVVQNTESPSAASPPTGVVWMVNPNRSRRACRSASAIRNVILMRWFDICSPDQMARRDRIC